MTNIIEQATRAGLRFKTATGLLTTEDLWNIQLEKKPKDGPNVATLYSIAVEKEQELQSNPVTSFSSKVSQSDARLKLEFNTVKYIWDTRIAERDAKDSAKLIEQENQEILAIIASKERKAKEDMSVEDLKKLLK